MIELLHGYFAKSDGRQYIVGKPSEGKDGRTRFRDAHYFRTMSQAVKFTMNRELYGKVEREEITTLAEFVRQAKALKDDITRKLELLDE